MSQIATALEYRGGQAVNDIYRRNRSEFTDDITTVIRQGNTRVRIFSPRGPT